MTARPSPAQRLSDLARLRRVRDRIDRDFALPLDVEALARGVHMSGGHLSREVSRGLWRIAVFVLDDQTDRTRDVVAPQG